MADNHLITPKVWKAITNLPGYEVSDHGEVRSFMKFYGGSKWVISKICQKILVPAIVKGYHCVNIRGKLRKIHRLVLLTFIGPCPKGFEACHNNSDQNNNYLINLRWDTPKNNQRDRGVHGTHSRGTNNPRSKLTEDQVTQIRKLYASKSFTQKEIAIMFNIGITSISHITTKFTWKHI